MLCDSVDLYIVENYTYLEIYHSKKNISRRASPVPAYNPVYFLMKSRVAPFRSNFFPALPHHMKKSRECFKHVTFVTCYPPPVTCHLSSLATYNPTIIPIYKYQTTWVSNRKPFGYKTSTQGLDHRVDWSSI